MDQQLQQKEAQLKTAQEQNRRVFERHSTVPLAVEELQDECMAAVKRAQLFLGTLAQQARAAQDMGGDWGTGCRRHVFASMQQLAVETGMLLAEWSEIFGIAVDDVAFEPMAQIERGRAAQVQEMYDALTGSHENQAHNRKVQRAAAREKSTGKKALGAPMKPREVLPADN